MRAIGLTEDGTLYAGGDFTNAGGGRVDHIAYWNGTVWSPMEDGLTEGVTITTVYAIATLGQDVYVGGEFTLAGGLPVGYVARWRQSWSPLGSGVSGYLPSVRGLALGNEEIIVAGDFTTAGRKPSVNIGIWNLSALSVEETGAGLAGVDAAPNPFTGLTTLRISIPEGKAAQVRITAHDALGRPVATLREALLEPGAHSVDWDASSLPSGHYYVRAQIGGRERVIGVTLMR